MSKIAIAVLAVAAFIYALWLVLFHRRLPDPKQAKGLRRRFILATLLFAGLFVATSAMGRRKPGQTCYMIAQPDQVRQSITSHKFGLALKAVWRTLDPKQAEEFRNKLQAAVEQSVVRKKTADMLAVAFSELAYHKERTRGKGRFTTCYKMTPLGNALRTTREKAFKQLELLNKARKSGTIDEKTAAKAHAVLAREVEMLHHSKGLEWPKDRLAQERLIQAYKSGELVPGDAASVAAAIIVEMEEGQVPDLTPAGRLAAMKNRVEKLLTGGEENLDGGPAGNDWMDPSIQPNVFTVLEKAGLIGSRPMVTCYEPAAVPVKTRSEELKKLQQQLLDKNVKAGVLDVEVAEKAATATAKEPEVDYATEKDIRNYQKKLRRAVRLLYKRGELPSSFVRKLEKAADIEFISFNPAKALRNDMRYYLRSLFRQPVGDEVLKVIEKRKLIPPARNHRLIMAWFGNEPEISEETRKKLADFEALIDSKEAFELSGDKNVEIEGWRIPQADTEYRLKIRSICRTFIKTGLVSQDRFKAIEDTIGIPIVGILETR